MPRKLVFIAVILLSSSVMISPIIYYQQPSAPKDSRELQLLTQNNTKQIEWQSIINSLPQFKKQLQQSASEINNLPPQITDSIIVGIVADELSSVLLVLSGTTDESSQLIEPAQIASSLENTNKILQLSVGQGWLDNWEIEQILPDSIIWLNRETKDSWQQFLFESGVNSEATAQKTISGNQ